MSSAYEYLGVLVAGVGLLNCIKYQSILMALV